MNRKSLVSHGFGLLFLTLFSLSAFAQDTTSSIKGNIFDSSGAIVAGASVEIRDTRTGVTRNLTSNDKGAFLAARLPVGGPYEITVNNTKKVLVDTIFLGDVYNVEIRMTTDMDLEEVIVTGTAAALMETAPGPSAVFTQFDMQTAVNFNRDIIDVYGVDPRINVDNDDRGFEINCGGKHPRFNSVTLDGVSMNDRFGLNTNGYSTAVGMPFPYDAIEQVAVELAPFDVSYGGFSACNINAVTKGGTNEFHGGVWLDYTNQNLRGDSLGKNSDDDFGTEDFNEYRKGFSVGGPIIKDKLFFFAAWMETARPTFLAMGYKGSGNGVERDWLSQTDYDRINSIASDIYGYDTGGQPGNPAVEEKKYMIRIDWNINDNHNFAFIYNKFKGAQTRSSDGDPNEFEFWNHFYVKGAESPTYTFKLASNWTDAFSTEVFYSDNKMDDAQVTVGPKDFADSQIEVGNRNTVYLGADDSRQANSLATRSKYFKLAANYLIGNHVISGGYEQEKLNIFNIFVQHSRGGEYDYFDDSAGNPVHCAGLSAQGRFDDPECNLSGIDKFELGRPNTIYYGSAGGTNNPLDAAADFTNTQHSVYVQDDLYLPDVDLSLVFGVRYDWFSSSDRPNYNAAFSEANGIRNDANIDGLSIFMPRFGFTWGINDTLVLRGGFGLFSGGNPNVWLSNAWSNDGVTNVQTRLSQSGGNPAGSILDGSIPLTNTGQPNVDVPQELYDEVAAAGPDNGATRRLVILDPNYKQPSEWKIAFGGTWQMPWWDIQMDFDYLHTESNDAAIYVDLSQSIISTTSTGQPIYGYTNGQDNYMLTNVKSDHGYSNLLSASFRKNFDFGLDLMVGYAYTSAKDYNPMTSFTAGSSWDNLATLDYNNPALGRTNYVVPNRFTFRGTWGHNFFGQYETRLSLLGYISEGQPASYVMGSSNGDLEGDGFFGRTLLYIPTGPGDPNVVFVDDFPMAAFDQWIEDNDYGTKRGKYVPRNDQNADWTTRFDFRIDQEVPFFFGSRARLFVKIYNLGNLLNDDWGLVTDAQFFSQQVITTDVDDEGRYVFNRFRARSVNDVLETRSLWQLRMGFEINF